MFAYTTSKKKSYKYLKLPKFFQAIFSLLVYQAVDFGEEYIIWRIHPLQRVTKTFSRHRKESMVDKATNQNIPIFPFLPNRTKNYNTTIISIPRCFSTNDDTQEAKIYLSSTQNLQNLYDPTGQCAHWAAIYWPLTVNYTTDIDTNK